MLSLDTLKFSVETNELDTAAKKIESLGTAISALSVDLSKLDKSSSAAAKAQAEANLANAKAEAIISKTSKATKDKADADDQSTKAVKENTSVLERQQSILEFMTQGFSKGQSSTLAYAKSTGILTNDLLELQSVLQSQRTLIGGDPFDRSLGALKSLQNEFKVLKEVQRLYNAEIPITQKQMENLALDKLRLIEAMKIEGKSMTEIKMALRDLNADYIGLATNINRITAADNALVKSNNDSAKSMNFLSREMERVDNVITGFSNNLNVTTSNRLMKFREQLKLSGIDAVTAAGMLKTYEDKLKSINDVSQTKAKNSREDELKYLARATSVQLGDIGISLAGGQNPLLVLIQQGDQLRGVLNQVGASGNEMQKALSMAFGQIVNGSKDVVVALGSFVVGAFVDTGKAVTKFGADLLGVSKYMEIWNNDRFTKWAAEGEAGFSKISRAMRVSELAVSALGVGIGVAIALVTAATVAFFKATNAQDDFVRTLISSGASLGITSDQALVLANSLKITGATTADVLKSFSEITKIGGVTKESLLLISEAALTLENVGGRSVKETTELFNKLGEKPVETLYKYAEATGLVTVQEIAKVDALIKTGDQLEANKLATELLSAATLEEANNIKSNLSPLAQLWIDIKNEINNATGALQRFATTGDSFGYLFSVIKNISVGFLDLIHQIRGITNAIVDTATIAIAVGKDAANFDLNATNYEKAKTAIYERNLAEKELYYDTRDRLKQVGIYSRENNQKLLEDSAEKSKAISKEAGAAQKAAKADEEINKLKEKYQKEELTRQQFINKAIEENNRIRGKGAELQGKPLDEYSKLLGKEYDKANKPKKVPKSDAVKEAEAIAKWYDKSLERVKDLENANTGQVEQLTKAQILMKDLKDDKQFGEISPELQKTLVMRLEAQAIKEKDVILEKELTKLAKEKTAFQQELTKVQEDSSKFISKEDESIQKTNSSIEMKTSLLGKTQDEQFAITTQYETQNKLLEAGNRFEAQRLKIKQDYDKLLPKSGMDSHIVEYERNKAMEALAKQQAETLNSINAESASKFEIAYSEKILNIGKTLSDAITTALFEGGQAGTKKLKDYIVGVFREKINIQINAVVNSVLGVGGSGGKSGGSSGGGSSEILSTISNALTGDGMLGTLGKATGLTNIFGAFSSGATLGSSAIMPGIEMMMSSSGISSFMGGAGQALGGAFAATGPYVLAAMALKELTAYKIDDKGGGITATVGGANGIVGDASRFREFQQTGGLFGGGVTTNRDWSVADKGVSDYIGKSVQAITEINKAYGKSIGLTSDAIGNFTKSIEINTTGMDAAAIQTAINAELVKFSVDQVNATYLDAIKEVARDGETSAQTLQRLSTDLTVVNNMFGTLGYTLYDLSVTGASAASELVTAFGGLDKMQASVGAYFNTMYTETEKAALTANQLATQFAALKDPLTGLLLSVPANKAAFRLLVEGIDITTAAGRDLAASVINLAPAFEQVSQAAQTAANNMLSAISNWGNSAELRAFKGQQLQQTLSNGGLNLSIDQIMGATQQSALEFYNSLDANSQQAQVLFANQQAIFDFVGGIKQSENQSKDSSGGGGSGGGISGDRAASSIANAWQAITDSIWNEVKRIRGLLQESSGDALNIAKQEFEKATIAARGGDQEAAKALPELSKTLLTISQSQSSTLIELRRAQALTANSLEQTVTQIAGQYGLTVPTFASGGNYEGGVALVGEQGPELINFNQGGYVHNAGQTASMLGGSDELISEIRRLNSKVEQLEAAAISTAISNTKLLKIFQRVTPDGNTIAISGTVDTV